MYCKVCGGHILGDGYTTVLHCENVCIDFGDSPEPDSNIVYCKKHEEHAILVYLEIVILIAIAIALAITVVVGGFLLSLHFIK